MANRETLNRLMGETKEEQERKMTKRLLRLTVAIHIEDPCLPVSGGQSFIEMLLSHPKMKLLTEDIFCFSISHQLLSGP